MATRSGPRAPARSSAHSCSSNIWGWARLIRRPRMPRAGLGESSVRPGTLLSAPMSKVRTVTGLPPAACRQLR